jgi:hypothetical protein
MGIAGLVGIRILDANITGALRGLSYTGYVFAEDQRLPFSRPNVDVREGWGTAMNRTIAKDFPQRNRVGGPTRGNDRSPRPRGCSVLELTTDQVTIARQGSSARASRCKVRPLALRDSARPPRGSTDLRAAPARSPVPGAGCSCGAKCQPGARRRSGFSPSCGARTSVFHSFRFHQTECGHLFGA